jgi:hypothetical protein
VGVKKTIVVGLILGLAALVVVAVLPGATASAGVRAERLQNLLVREQSVFADQQQRLELSAEVIQKTHEWIDALNAAGEDTSALEAAVNEYEVTMVTASQYLGIAKSALEAKSGFDASGKVTNMTQALSTVKKAGRAERHVHVAITPAAIAFRDAVLAYRRAN